MHIDQKSVNELVASIYDACLDGSRWQPTLQSILRHLDANGGQLWSPFLDAKGGGFDFAESGHDFNMRSEYAAYYRHHDLWFQRAEARCLTTGTILTDRELISEREFSGSEFWADFLRKTDSYRMCTGIILGGAGSTQPLVTFTGFRGVRADDFGSTERRLLTHLLPHLRRAVSLHWQFAATLSSPALQVMDKLATPVLILSVDATLIHANAAAERLAHDYPVFKIHRQRLRLPTEKDQQRLLSLLHHASQQYSSLPEGVSTTLSIDLGSRVNAFLEVGCLRQENHLQMDRAVAVVLVRTDAIDAVSVPELRTSYGLTKSETETAVQLIRGHSPDEIAAMRQVSINTVRTQLKQIFSKTGAQRQSDLVRMLITRHSHLIR